jgi:tetratricopeptide (TPR) repeat protein
MFTTHQRHQGLSADLARRAAAVEKAMSERRLGDATRGLAVLTQQAGMHPEVLRLRGVIAFQDGRAQDALDPLVNSIRQRPQDPLAFSYLAACYEALGDQENALKAFRKACELAPENAKHWLNFGRVLTASGLNEHAAVVLQQTLKIAPQDQLARAMLASALNQEGRSADAVAEYRKILAQNPASGASWWGLAVIKPTPLVAEDIARMRTVLGQPGTDRDERIPTHFALAHVLEHIGDYAGALESLSQAHALMVAKQNTWNETETRKITRRSLDAFSDLPAPMPNDAGREVIFIVSMPRSGSTLTEQILASHSTVSGTLELLDLPQIVRACSGQHQVPYPEWTPKLSPSDWHALGQYYLQRTERWRRERPRMTDKMPGNWHYIGAILSMLPNARVVVVRRDPLETCLACYRMLLQGHDYTHDFSSLAECWRQFDESVDAWQTRAPDRVRVQSYEALTRQPEAQIRELLGFCDLPFEEACLNFHTTKRRVSTPSSAQVREPIRSDTARADRYGTLLDPLRSALGLPAFTGTDA